LQKSGWEGINIHGWKIGNPIWIGEGLLKWKIEFGKENSKFDV